MMYALRVTSAPRSVSCADLMCACVQFEWEKQRNLPPEFTPPILQYAMRLVLSADLLLSAQLCCVVCVVVRW
jgi:hypothetical protein